MSLHFHWFLPTYGDRRFIGASPVVHGREEVNWGEPPAAVAAKIAWIRDLAEVQGRTLDCGIRLHVISRDTSEQVWAEADRLLGALDPATVEKAQQSVYVDLLLPATGVAAV